MSVLSELAQHAAANIADLTFDAIGTTGNVFVYVLPQSPDVAVSLRRYGGAEADTRTGWDEPSVQAHVRGTPDPRTGEELAQAIYDLWHGWSGDLPDGTEVVHMVGIQSGPVWLSQDDNNRHEFVVNLRCHIRNTDRPYA